MHGCTGGGGGDGLGGGSGGDGGSGGGDGGDGADGGSVGDGGGADGGEQKNTSDDLQCVPPSGGSMHSLVLRETCPITKYAEQPPLTVTRSS